MKDIINKIKLNELNDNSKVNSSILDKYDISDEAYLTVLGSYFKENLTIRELSLLLNYYVAETFLKSKGFKIIKVIESFNQYYFKTDMYNSVQFICDIGTFKSTLKGDDGFYYSYSGLQVLSDIGDEIIINKKFSNNGMKRKYKTYLMYEKSFNAYKIGKAINPNKREKTLSAEFPNITLFAICDKNIERKLHLEFSHKKLRGEWFNLNNNDLKVIMKYGFKIQ